MDGQLALIFFLTFVIHLIGTLAYSVRIAGTRTGRIAVSLSLFNILVLVSRTSNSFQAPLLAKRVEENLPRAVGSGIESDFRWLLLSATLATLAGAFLIPTFQRLFARAVEVFGRYRSVPRLLLRGFSPAGLLHVRNSLRIPAKENLTELRSAPRIPMLVIVLNAVAMAIWTVGVFSALYAGYLHPEYRVTASQLSAVINGVATILMFVMIDPYLSVLTDEAAEGKISGGYFRRSVVWLTGSRLAGTVLAQLLLVPGAHAIGSVAEWL
jgi:Alternate to MurJ